MPLYFSSILSSKDLSKVKDNKVFQDLLQNRLNGGLNFKKVKGHQNLYSARINNSARLLFTFVEHEEHKKLLLLCLVEPGEVCWLLHLLEDLLGLHKKLLLLIKKLSCQLLWVYVNALRKDVNLEKGLKLLK